MPLFPFPDRRAALGLLLAGTSQFAGSTMQTAAKSLKALEAEAGGRLGVSILDTSNGELVGHRQNERFALCSTFKLILAAEVLRDIDLGLLQRDQFVSYNQSDMVPHAPVTQAHLAEGGMRLIDLARATQVTSDNPAANLLIHLLGGPQAVTRRFREAGDRVTRLDRYEPMLNLVEPGSQFDTTSPAAMARLVARYLIGDYLSDLAKRSLTGWLVETTTGLRRIRAGLPSGWRAGDKTGTVVGTNGQDFYNDVAIIWPPSHRPLIVAAYYSPAVSSAEINPLHEAVLASVGRIATTRAKIGWKA